jgi:hypothetical protein
MARRRRSAESRPASQQAESGTTGDFSQMSDAELLSGINSAQEALLSGDEETLRTVGDLKQPEPIHLRQPLQDDDNAETEEGDDLEDDDEVVNEEDEDEGEDEDEAEEDTVDEESSRKKRKSKADDEEEDEVLSIDDLERERLQMEMRHHESQAGAQAARAGHLERQLRDLKDQLSRGGRQSTADSDGDGTEDPVLNRRIADIEDRERRLARQQVSGEVATAIRSAGQDFISEQMNEEVRKSKSMSKRVKTLVEQAFQAISESDQDVKHVLESDDPEYARLEAKRILNREFSRLYRRDIQARIKAAEGRRGSSAQKLKQKKRASAVSQSGGKRNKARSRSRDPETMPLKDLKREIERLGIG